MASTIASCFLSHKAFKGRKPGFNPNVPSRSITLPKGPLFSLSSPLRGGCRARFGRSSRYLLSPNGTTIFRPSAAPRMKIATRVLRFLPSVAAARASHIGASPIPAIAIADPRRKIRRVNTGRYLL